MVFNRSFFQLISTVILCFSFFSPVYAATPQLTESWTTVGFSDPESVLVDRQQQHIIVSNINSNSADEKGKGFLTLLSMDGNVLKRRWISGFEAPTGMAQMGRKLYVVDGYQVHIVDLGQGKIQKTIDIKEAQSLQDAIVGPDDAIYVTDAIGNAIYRIDESDHAALWMMDPALNHPNKISRDNQRFIVASSGVGVNADVATAPSAGLLTIDFKQKTIAPIASTRDIKNIASVSQYNDAVYFTDRTGKLLRVDNMGVLSTIATFPPETTNFSIADDMLFVSQQKMGHITLFTLTAD